MEIKLGSKVKDKVTGIKGIAISRVEYLTGCVQYGVQPEAKKGSNAVPDSFYIDIERLTVVGLGISLKTKPTGGVMRDAPKSNHH